ncbi:MAG: NUDIX hydrolase [Methyloceanibacter sp.]|jgi:8-oxo-dGTP diphosphatase
MGFPPTPALTVDCVVFDPQGRVLLIRRGREPFKGCYALPGGFVDVGETIDEGCRRELREETGLTVGDLLLVGVYSDPSRDPRGHTVSTVFLTCLSKPASAVAGDDAASAEWVENWRDEPLAFDHAQILDDAAKFRAAISQD